MRAVIGLYVGTDSNLQLVLATENSDVVRAACREMLARDVAPPVDELGRARVTTLERIAQEGS